MRISLRAALVTAAVALGLIAGSVAPVQAATGWDRCPKGMFCVFDGRGGEGAMTSYSATQASLGTWASKVSSVDNRTGYQYFCLYDHPNFAGVRVIGGTSYGEMDLALVDHRLDNHVGSFRLAHTGRQCVGEPEPFLWEAPYGMVSGAPAQSFGDLNGDGTVDLLNRTYEGRLWFLRGDGHGTLIGGGWNAMTVLTRHGDLNGDGHEDLLARDTTGRLWFYPGDGRGAFRPRALVGGGWNTMSRIQATGDLNGDGRGDLVARDTAGKLWMYPGNGRGAFGARALVGGGWNTMNAFAAPGDLSGDGHNDLVVSDTSGKLWLYPGNARGYFGARKMIGTGGWGAYPRLLGLGTIPYAHYPALLAQQSLAPDGAGGEMHTYTAATAGGSLSDQGVDGFLDFGDAMF